MGQCFSCATSRERERKRLAAAGWHYPPDPVRGASRSGKWGQYEEERAQYWRSQHPTRYHVL